ncbi:MULTISPECIES: hypothetical protein [Spirulina sp. CCY15215]|uniref:hypothetical protein n=1 Tax=Spirulina sp. CCY15215 TaxID=2767591 RepID=UPI00195145A0
MKLKSTSIHNINADRPLNNIEKFLYRILNVVNNLWTYRQVDQDLQLEQFNVNNLEVYWNQSALNSSPSRKLSDLFWMNLSWDLIQDELGEIRLMDMGCGSGNYSWRLNDWSKGKITEYLGIDNRENKNWQSLQQQYPNFKFFQLSSEYFIDKIPNNINFFMSQSAIEHFEQDLLYFEQIKNYILQSDRANIIQVHLFPSAACNSTYLYHGVRQYTPRTVSKITTLFKDFSDCILFSLGGKFCNQLHYRTITLPVLKKMERLDTSQPKEYEKMLFSSIEKDMNIFQRYPAFYALVIHSNGTQKLF